MIEPRPDQSEVSFDSLGGHTAYLEVYDKTRMTGARTAAVGVLFGAVGGITYAIADNTRIGTEGPAGHIEPLSQADALPILTTLVRSD